MAEAKKPAAKSGTQRREAVRVDVLLPVYFTVEKYNVKSEFVQPPNLGSSINLSASGMLLATDRELAEGSRIMASFKLFEGEEDVFSEAVVLCTIPQQEGAIKKFLSHLRFDSADPEFDAKVARFVTHRQQSLRRQGLL